MKIFTLLAATAAAGAIASPAAAQYYPQQGYAYPQQSYQYPPQGYAYPQQGYAYPQQGYAYPQQGYAYPQQQSGIAGIINQLLGNRYNVTDRQAVTQCAAAAQAQAAAQYRPVNAYGAYGQQPYGAYGQQPYGQPYGAYGQQPYGGYNPASSARVTGITNVERRSNGLRVSGLINSGLYGQGGQGGYGGYGAYGQANNPAYAQAGSDLTFRCNVDYRGVVTNVRVRQNTAYRRGY